MFYQKIILILGGPRRKVDKYENIQSAWIIDENEYDLLEDYEFFHKRASN